MADPGGRRRHRLRTGARIAGRAKVPVRQGYAGTGGVRRGVFAEHPIGATRFTWTPDVAAGWIDGRNEPRYRRARYSASDHILLLGAGARFRYGAPGNWYHHLFLGFQPALHTGRTRAPSSACEFVSTLGWQAKRFSVQIRHISNGSLHEPNCGETMLLLGVRLH